MDQIDDYKGYFVKAAYRQNPESGKWKIRAVILNLRGVPIICRTEIATDELEGTEQDAVNQCLELGRRWVDQNPLTIPINPQSPESA